MSKTKTKVIFVGENLALLRQLSPVVKAIDPAKDSLEIRAEDIFKDTKKGKTAKEKLYILSKLINLGEGEPLFVEKKFGQVTVRSDISSKEEVEKILKEIGIDNPKPLFERAKAHLQGKAGEGVAPSRPAVQKGKPEHEDPFRGARSFRGRFYGEGPPEDYFNNVGDFEEGMPDLNRPSRMSASERRGQEKRDAAYADYVRKQAEAAAKLRHSFDVEAPRVWAETHAGEPYPPRDPGWQWVPESHSWQYFAAGYNPFYNDSYWSRNRGTGAAGPSASARAAAGEGAPPRPSAAKKSCETILAEHGISVEDKGSFRKWALEHHPDKGGDETIFKEVSGCWTSLTKGGTRRNRKNRKNRRKARKTRRW